MGGKGGSLGELLRAGVDVPAGFVVGTHAFEGCMARLESLAPFRALVERLSADDLPAVSALSAALRARIEGVDSRPGSARPTFKAPTPHSATPRRRRWSP